MRMEEDGGHAVTISLATSLNGEVQAGGDPWQVVRGCQKVVAYLGRDLDFSVHQSMQGPISFSFCALL